MFHDDVGAVDMEKVLQEGPYASRPSKKMKKKKKSKAKEIEIPKTSDYEIIQLTKAEKEEIYVPDWDLEHGSMLHKKESS